MQTYCKTYSFIKYAHTHPIEEEGRLTFPSILLQSIDAVCLSLHPTHTPSTYQLIGFPHGMVLNFSHLNSLVAYCGKMQQFITQFVLYFSQEPNHGSTGTTPLLVYIYNWGGWERDTVQYVVCYIRGYRHSTCSYHSVHRGAAAYNKLQSEIQGCSKEGLLFNSTGQINLFSSDANVTIAYVLTEQNNLCLTSQHLRPTC